MVIDPPALSDRQHQRIAAELNLSETVFLRSREDRGAWDARIFTPAAELPFAGHPTVGAAIALVDRGLVDDRVVLHEGVGAVAVRLEDGRATLTTPVAPGRVAGGDTTDVAGVLGLAAEDLHADLPPEGWSAGVPFTIATLRDVAALGRVRLDAARWTDALAASPAPDLYVVAPVEGSDGTRWRARMFAPTMGIAEDPATGAAAAATCGYLIHHLGAGRAEQGWTVQQGVELGRPSIIHIAATLEDGAVRSVNVGGAAVRVGRGELALPA